MTSFSLSSVSQRTTRIISNTRLQDVMSLLLIGVPAAFVAMVNVHISYDDAFITYRYAYNLATGQGFVYNPGEWFMGTTAPFYGMLRWSGFWPGCSSSAIACCRTPSAARCCSRPR